MPSATDDTGTDQVLAAEREHLLGARESLRLMRENVLALPALAGDRVSEQYLKADLYRRAQALRDLPDAPLFFGRLDYAVAPDLAQVQADEARPGQGTSGQEPRAREPRAREPRAREPRPGNLGPAAGHGRRFRLAALR